VASHVGNPCGHSFCGECGWQWHIQKRNKGCPCCRRTLDENLPMIPNIALDNTVEKHLKALALTGASEWEPHGQKFVDWDARKQWVPFGSILLVNLMITLSQGVAQGCRNKRGKEGSSSAETHHVGGYSGL
ncbi:hypothetical protein CPB84DRAFT_1684359, partial [Gymnopilus junonius]